jgi:Putative DNA-binding domain
LEEMALTGKRLDALTPGDLHALFDDAVAEGRDIEFKASVGKSDADKREFLADVSSFANAAGGDLVIGIREKEGVGVKFAAIPAEEADAEVLRLESIVRDGIDPRIPGVETRAVATPTGDGVVLVIRIPRSFAAPHMVTFGNLSRFYSRNSAGKYQLDVSEIRAVFAYSESARTALRNFRIERLGRITANETPVSLPSNPKTVLHLIPLTAADPSVQIDAASVAANLQEFRPLYGSGWDTRINFDGAVAYAPHRDESLAVAYTQLFRTGAVEGVEAFMLRREYHGGDHPIPSLLFERTLIEALRLYLSLLHRVGVSPPYLLGLSLLDVRGQVMAVDPRLTSPFGPSHPIDRDDLIVPELLIEDAMIPTATILKPALDAVWQAAGWRGSLNYDADGVWQDR